MSQLRSTPLKRTLYASAVLFALIFLNDLLSLGGIPLLALVSIYLVLGITLIVQVSAYGVTGKLRTFLLLTGFSSFGFSLGVVYGVLGMWGLYVINDAIYLSVTIACWAGFITGLAGSIIIYRNGGRRDAASTI